MDPGVKAAWISSTLALAVAVIGIIATGIAQWWGSNRAHANALALFEAQAAVQNRIRAEEAVERTSTTFLADRWAVYAQFMRAMKRLEDAKDKIDELTARLSALGAEPSSDLERDRTRLAAFGATNAERQNAFDSRMAAHEEVAMKLGEILLLAPDEVADAARNWYRIWKDADNRGYGVFVNAARSDVAAQPLIRPPLA